MGLVRLPEDDLLAACVVLAAMFGLTWLADNLWILGVGLVLLGAAGAVWWALNNQL